MFKLLTLVIVVFTCFTNSFAKNFKKDESFKKLEDFISKINTIQGNITEISPKGEATSNFYFQVPARLRINYTSKNLPLNVIITQTILTYYDTQLDQKSQVKTPEGILKLILNDRLSLLNKEINIKNFIIKNDEIIVDLTYSPFPENKIKLIFNANNFYLKSIKITDEVNTTTMKFKNLIFNSKISDKIFVIKNKKIDSKFDF
jgi:outer membrane lipoprotein-sorting protein